MVAGLIFLWHWASQPAENTAKVTPPTITPTTTLQQIDTDYFYTHLPSDYRIDKESTVTGPAVHISATQQIAKGIQIGITSTPLPQAGITEVADYHLRVTQGDAYSRMTIPGLSEDARTFISATTEPLQITTFLQHNGRYASVTLSSYSSSKDALTMQLKQIVTDWRWK